jgi:hypothetical protein
MVELAMTEEFRVCGTSPSKHRIQPIAVREGVPIERWWPDGSEYQEHSLPPPGPVKASRKRTPQKLVMNGDLRPADALYKAHVPTCQKCLNGEAGLGDGMVSPTHGCPEMRRIFRLLKAAQTPQSGSELESTGRTGAI